MSSIFRYVVNRLWLLTDEEIEAIDLDSALETISKAKLAPEEIEEFENLFSEIRKYAALEHHGVVGMKWGVRRYQNKDGSPTAKGKARLANDAAKQSIFGTASTFKIPTKNGETLTAEPVKPFTKGEKIVNALLGAQEKDVLGRRGDANYTIHDKDGKNIGELSLMSKDSKTTYWDWITIDEDQRGQGYATSIINTLIDEAQTAGYEKVKINALKEPRPLYERIGFTYTTDQSIIERIQGFELGAKPMEYDLKKVKHSDLELQHYGVLGMKWGVRRDRSGSGSKKSPGSEDYKKARKLKSKGVQNLSNDELKALTTRMNLERQYKDLSKKDVSAGRSYVSSVVNRIGDRVIDRAINGIIDAGVSAVTGKRKK